MPTLRFRLPGRSRDLGAWLSPLLPKVDRGTRREWVLAGRVRVEGRVVDRPGVRCRAGALVEIEDVAADAVPGWPEPAACAWWAWVDGPAGSSGSLRAGGSPKGERPLDFEVQDRREGMALLRVAGADPVESEPLCAALAELGMPVAGDLIHRGLARIGGPAMACDRETALALGPFDMPPWPTPEPDAESDDGGAGAAVDGAGDAAKAAEREAMLRLVLSQEAIRALERGHPWILPDEASESAQVFRPGTPVRLEARDGRVVGFAWTEGDDRVAGRVAGLGSQGWRALPSIEARVARALARRAGLLAGGGMATNAFRLVHGEADGLPGLFVDRLGPLLRVLVTSRASDGFRERAVAALLAQLPVSPEGEAWSVLEVLHLRGRAREAFDSVRWMAGGVEALRATGAQVGGGLLRVEERGLLFDVDPGWDAPRRTRPGYGLFLDQRENRERLVPLAAGGGRWLNLFAHTGAFSAALLAAGAEAVDSVDLSAPYLDRLEANLRANAGRGVDPARHTSIRAEGRRHLETLEDGQRYAGIVVDPPTAAAAGRRFWSVARDLEPLLELCVARLDEGGALLVTQNRRGAALGLDGILERIVARAGRPVRRIEPAPPGLDHPSLAGFPEGDPFEGALLVLDGAPA